MFRELLAGLVAGLGARITKAKETRLSVFRKVNRERAYQALKWKPSEGDDVIGTAIAEKGTVVLEKPHEIGAWISFMETYTEYARDDNTGGDQEEALANIRKAVALGVACLEQHGCPDRHEDDFDVVKAVPLAEPVDLAADAEAQASGFTFPAHHGPTPGDTYAPRPTPFPPMTEEEGTRLDRMIPKCNVENCPVHGEGGILDQMKAGHLPRPTS